MEAPLAAGQRPGHVVLLGDSIFDNAAYVGGDPDVVTQLRQELPRWRCSLLAVDGDVMAGMERQLAAVPPDATHLVVSVGGNDALGYAPLLQEQAPSVAVALAILANAQRRFGSDYDAVTDALMNMGLPVAVCTIYDTPPSGPDQAIIKAALCLFNDSITRVAFSRGAALIDLRLICTEDGDYANAIEPSSRGGLKIARAIASFATADHRTPPPIVVTGGLPH
jgi:hypothetical protein